MKPSRHVVLLFSLVLTCSAQSAKSSEYKQLARESLKELVEIKTTESGVGSTPAAEAIARRLRAAGFPESDVQVIGAPERKKNVVARIHGTAKAKPILFLGHLDVVEANSEDWSPDLDPFRLTERDGYFYGRGTQDMKQSVAILVTNFIRWKREGWVPDRDLILACTSDEEQYGDEVGIVWLLKNRRDLIDAEYSINGDAGDFQTKNGQPYSVTVSAGEKKETMIQLQTINPGGHGSIPRPDNAIYELAAALRKVEQFKFPAMLNDVTRAEFAGLATLESGEVSADMRAVARDPADPQAIERLSRDPYYNALLRTTCVATVVEAGHWISALPQRAKAVLNCRIIAGHSPDDVLSTLRQAIADDHVEVKWQFLEPGDSIISPLRPDLFSTMRQIAHQIWPGAAVMPAYDTGGSDGRFLRTAGIPSYGVSGVFFEQGDMRAHGRDERIRVKDFEDGVDFYDRFVKALVSHP